MPKFLIFLFSRRFDHRDRHRTEILLYLQLLFSHHLMSASSILPTLISHPTRVFSQWYSSVSAFAACIGTADFTYGLVHLVISPQAWAALPGNTAPNGDVAPVPNPPPPGTLAGNASAATVHLYREDVELHRRYLGYVASLRAALLESLGPEIQISLRDPQHNIIIQFIPHIMAAMRTSYGTAAAADIEALLVQLSEPIQGGDHDTFMSFTIGFRQIVAALDRAGQPLSQYMQCRRLQEATVSQSNIARAVAFYFETNPLLADQSLAELIQFVLRQLQNTDRRQRKRQSRGQSNSTSGPRLSSGVDTTLPTHSSGHYCYQHGFGGHPSSTCNFMRRSTAHTAAMRAATSPTDVPGGHP
jgi:hypothetical protein